MKRQFFTLVELLLVIAIIAILAGIAIPVVGGMNKKGKETKARSEISAIKLAFQQFEADYGAFPQITNTSHASKNVAEILKDDLITTDGDMKLNTKFNSMGDAKYNFVYDEFIQILNMTAASDSSAKDSADKVIDKGAAYTGTTNPNKKRKRYLDPPTTLVKDPNYPGNENADIKKNDKYGYFFLDPWGRRYNIALDWNYDGKIKNTSTDKFGGETEDLMGKIFIFSYGEGKRGEKDYITSWRTSK